MEALDELLTKNPRLVPGDYSDVVRALKKVHHSLVTRNRDES